MDIVEDDEDALPPLESLLPGNQLQSPEKGDGQKMLVDEGDDDDDDDSEEGPGVQNVDDDDDDEEEDEEDDDEDDDEGVAASQSSKFARTFLNMDEADADEWAENFVADSMGELDDQAQNIVGLISELFLRAVSNKKTPFMDSASETSRKLVQDLDAYKRQLIESI